MLSLAIQKRYQQEVEDWLTTLSSNQLSSVMDVLFEEEEFTIFKQEIEKVK